MNRFAKPLFAGLITTLMIIPQVSSCTKEVDPRENVSIVISEPELNEDSTDFNITVTIEGVTSVYGGTVPKDKGQIDRLTDYLNGADALTSYAVSKNYEGSVFGFPSTDANKDVKVEPGETYVIWAAPDLNGVAYVSSDIVYKEFTLPEKKAETPDKEDDPDQGEKPGEEDPGEEEPGEDDPSEEEPGEEEPGEEENPGEDQEGGIFGTAEITRVSISVPVTVEGAKAVNYAFLETKKANRYTTDDARRQYLVSNGTITQESSVTAFIDGLTPDSDMTIFAAGIFDDETAGEVYGTVEVKDFVTEKLTYNSLEVTIEALNITSNSADIKVNVAGGEATEYIWWIGSMEDSFWKNSMYLGGSKAKAQQFMALYPDNAAIQLAMNDYKMTDGVIRATDLDILTQHVALVLAKDETGEFSKAGYITFETLAIDLGTIARSSDQKWIDVKNATTVEFPSRSFISSNGMLSAKYSINFSGPTNLTALVLLGSTGYFEPDSSTEDMIISIIGYTDKTRDVGHSVPVYDEDGNIVLDENGNPQSMNDPVKTGQLILWNYYTHGCPDYGYVVYFSAQDHNEANCERCDEAQKKIDDKMSLDYYLGLVPEQYYWCKTEDEARNAYETYMATPEFVDHYSNATPISYVNNGEKINLYQPDAIGDTEYDKVYVVYRELDTDGTYNYYEPMVYDLPEGCFDIATE